MTELVLRLDATTAGSMDEKRNGCCNNSVEKVAMVLCMKESREESVSRLPRWKKLLAEILFVEDSAESIPIQNIVSMKHH